MAFNIPDEPIADIVGTYRRMLDRLAAGGEVDHTEIGDLRDVLHGAFTRGHFARAV
jgi:hypothetical protein